MDLRRAGMLLLLCGLPAAGCRCVWGMEEPTLIQTGGAGGTGGTGGEGAGGGSTTTGSGDPTCTDGVKNQDETDKDCGGGTCPPCKVGEGCIVGPDCETNACVGGTCVAPDCADKIKNGTETDTDCGGPACPKCANGLMCQTGDDCQSGICTLGVCQDPHIWSRYFPAATSTNVEAISADELGNVFLAINLASTVDLGDGEVTSAGAQDMVVVKLGDGGATLWSKVFGDLSDQVIRGLAADKSGGVVFTGSLSGSANFGGEVLWSAGGCCPASSDVVIVRLDDSGKHIWSKNFGNSSPQVGAAVAIDPSGAVIVAGELTGSADFGGAILTSADKSDVFVVKLDQSGSHVWSKRWGATEDQSARLVGVDQEGNVFLAGHFRGGLDFGDGAISYVGGVDVFLAKLDPSGNLLWKRGYGSGLDETVGGLAVDGEGGVVLVGTFHESVNLGGGPLNSAGGADFFAVKLDAGGNHIWSRRFGDGTEQSIIRVGSDVAGNTILTGALLGTLDFGNGPMPSAGGKDIFIAKLDALGKHLWSRRFGDGGDQESRAVAIGAGTAVFFAGNFGGTIDLGGGPAASIEGNDVFVARFVTP